jgi:hypothetical protein
MKHQLELALQLPNLPTSLAPFEADVNSLRDELDKLLLEFTKYTGKIIDCSAIPDEYLEHEPYVFKICADYLGINGPLSFWANYVTSEEINISPRKTSKKIALEEELPPLPSLGYYVDLDIMDCYREYIRTSFYFFVEMFNRNITEFAYKDDVLIEQYVEYIMSKIFDKEGNPLYYGNQGIESKESLEP